MPKKKQTPTKASEVQEVPTVNEDSSNFGNIQINLGVVETLVRLAAKEVEGVHSVVRSGLVDDVSSFITKKEPVRPIQVEEENNCYIITVRLNMLIGYELAKTAYEVQQVVCDSVYKMTNQRVAKIDVKIEDVKNKDESKHEISEEDVDLPTHNTD